MWDHCRTLSDAKHRQIKHKIIQDNLLVIYKSTAMYAIYIVCDPDIANTWTIRGFF